MIRTTLVRAGLAAALAISIPAALGAQEDGLEGVDWQLVSYRDGTDLLATPWHVDAALRFEGGVATGSSGCNSLGVRYELEGDELTFASSGTDGDIGCAGPVLAVEQGLVEALPRVMRWGIDSGPATATLYLYDADDEALLAFQPSSLSLAPADIDALADRLDRLQAQLDRHEDRIDNIRIGTLRDRIKTLESQMSERAGPDPSTFTTAERVLLSAVRPDIARTCEPRRSQNPGGTVAALQCRPQTPAVKDMAYYLMEGDDAWKAYRQRMNQHDVRNGTERRACAFGNPSQMAWTGAGLVSAGCYRNDDGLANLRFTNTLTECKQLKAGNAQVESPHVYIAVLGANRDIAGLWEWAASSTDWEAGDDLFDPIKQAGQPWSDMCPR